MKVKVYRVVPKHNSNEISYMVEAPNKRMAKWCGAKFYNNDYSAFLSDKDMIAKRFRVTEAKIEEVEEEK